jgi:branched-chain amino acid transport system permease protein
LTLALSFCGGVAVHQAVIRPFANRPELTIVLVTIALLVFFNGLAAWIWGPGEKFFQSPFPLRVLHVGDVVMNLQDLGVIGISLACVAAVFALFRFTRVGLQMRAAALAPATSRLLGIRVTPMLTIGWGLAAMLSAVAGMMAAQALVLSPNYMDVVLVYAFIAAVLGGIDSPLGAVVGALLLGVVLNLLTEYVSWLGSSLQLPVALAGLLVVLVLKPAGLFGRVVVRRV